jgi:hypothetical protein
VTLVLHVGAPKTATSTLQGAFFPRHPGMVFLGKIVDEKNGFTGWRTPELTQLMLALERTHLDFAPDRAAAAAMVAAIATEAAGRPVVISSEDLCLFSAVDPFAKLARVTELFGSLGPVRLILAVREQVTLLRSIYLTEHRGEMMRLPGTRQNWYPSFDQYLDIQFRYAWGSTLECFRFSAMIDRYEALLGAANVFVYAFDDFVRDPGAGLQRLCRFIGVADDAVSLEPSPAGHQNRHYSRRTYWYSALRNRLGPALGLSRFAPKPLVDRFRTWIAAGDAVDFSPSPEARRRIADYYRADNALLLRKRGIDLH